MEGRSAAAERRSLAWELVHSVSMFMDSSSPPEGASIQEGPELPTTAYAAWVVVGMEEEEEVVVEVVVEVVEVVEVVVEGEVEVEVEHL